MARLLTRRLAGIAAAVASSAILLTVNGRAQTTQTLENDGRADIPMGTTEGKKYGRLLIRNATIISGRGAPGRGQATPPEGPVDIVIENGRIVQIVSADPISLGRRSRPQGDAIIDAAGMYVLPGFFDLHDRVQHEIAGERSMDYVYRLQLAHGITTIRDPNTSAGLPVATEQRRLSKENRIVAPRIFLCSRPSAWGATPEEAREVVRRAAQEGADCMKIAASPRGGTYPDMIEAIVAESEALGMPGGTMIDMKITETDAVVASNAGVRTIEHWYGIPDAALPGTQALPVDYNYADELMRFRWAGRLWAEADRYPDRLSKVIDLMISKGVLWTTTLVVYEAHRDLVRAATLPWHAKYSHPGYFDDKWFPQEGVHAAHFHNWTTADEVAWKKNYQIWMKWIYEFWSRGGKIVSGSDAQSMYELHGFALIRELELLQEAGIPPLDVIRIATTNSAAAVGMEKELCGIRVGCVADVIVVDGNPLENFKVLYGGGYGYYATAEERTGGVRWTLKEGVVFDAPALLKEAEWYVRQAREGRSR